MYTRFTCLTNKNAQLLFQIPNIFKDKKCAQFERLQENRFQQDVQEYKQTGARGNILSGLGNIFRQG